MDDEAGVLRAGHRLDPVGRDVELAQVEQVGMGGGEIGEPARLVEQEGIEPDHAADAEARRVADKELQEVATEEAGAAGDQHRRALEPFPSGQARADPFEILHHNRISHRVSLR